MVHEELHRDALPGYNRITVALLSRVDVEIFLRLADETRGGLSVDGDGTFCTGQCPSEHHG